jgi:hypothetical protein
MRKIIVRVPNRCSIECPLVKRAYQSTHMFLKCKYREEFRYMSRSLKPVKACREAEVK